MKLTFAGCGDAFGTDGRFNTCFVVDAKADRFLIDCGASSLIALKRLKIDPDSIRTVLVSHLHGDHFGGLIFLLREATLYKRRTSPLRIVGPVGLANPLRTAMECFFPGGWVDSTSFELELVELLPYAAADFDSGHLQLFPSEHYSGSPSSSLRIGVDGKVLTYSGDTPWSDTLEKAAFDSDVFVCEAYSYAKKRGTHVDFQSLARRLPHVRSKRVILTHLGPDMIEQLSEISRNFVVAHDGMTVEL